MKELKDAYISSAEAAKILGIHPKAIHKLINSGKIPAEKIANRWLIPKAFIIDFSKRYRPKTGRPVGGSQRRTEGEYDVLWV